MPNKTQYHYSNYIIVFHVITAIFLITAVVLGYCAIYLADDYKLFVLMLHRSIGLMGVLASFSMLAARIHQKPRLVLESSRFNDFIRRMVKLSLYALPILIFVTGFLALAFKIPHITFFQFIVVPSFVRPNAMYKTLFSCLHYWLNVFFVLAITIHVRAVLHHFLTHRRLLYRMFPCKFFTRKK